MINHHVTISGLLDHFNFVKQTLVVMVVSDSTVSFAVRHDRMRFYKILKNNNMRVVYVQ